MDLAVFAYGSYAPKLGTYSQISFMIVVGDVRRSLSIIGYTMVKYKHATQSVSGTEIRAAFHTVNNGCTIRTALVKIGGKNVR